MKTLATLIALALPIQSTLVAAQDFATAPMFDHPAVIRVSDDEVAAQVANCNQWLQLLHELPENHEWVEFQQPPKPPLKDEFETSLEFERRIAAYGRNIEPIWVNVAFAVDPEALSYDADSGQLSVHYRTDKTGLSGSFTEGRAYTGVNAFGVTAQVTPKNLRTTGATFEPGATVLPRDLRFALPADQARELREAGVIHVLGLLRGTSGSGGFSGATLDSPSDFSYGHRDVRIQPICVAVTVANRHINQWRSFSAPVAPSASTPARPIAATMQRALQDYPARALRQELQGRVGFRVSVDRNGRATECRVTSSSGHAVLDESACENVRRYARFEPATRYGEPVEGQYDGALSYSLGS